MVMTNREMLDRITLLSNFGKESGDWGYAIARNSRKMKEEAREYMEMVAETFKKYAVPDESDPEHKKMVPNDVWERELGGVSNAEIDVDIYMVPKEIFVEQGLTATEMEKLLWMVKED